MIYRAEVLESRPLTPSAHMIRVEKAPGFAYLPVQFCGLELVTSAGGVEYPMSLASSPTQEFLEFGARLSSSPWKTAFAALRPSDEVEIDGAYGHFVLDTARDAVFVAGGIGITPLKGMADYLADTQSPRHAVLIYGNRSQDEIAYRKDLDRLEQVNRNFTVLHTLSREPSNSGWTGRRGRIDTALLQDAASRLQDPVYYLCGRGAMVMEVGQALLRLGVSRERIAFEVFRGYS